MFLSPAHQVIVRIPITDKLTRDISFPIDIPYGDFRDRIVATMTIDPRTAQLGWKTSNEGERAAAHELQDHSALENAFKAILTIQDNPHRRKEIFLKIVHLV